MLFAEIVAASSSSKNEQLKMPDSLKKEKPRTQEELLKRLEEGKQDAIDNDEEKLRDEAQKIAHLQHQIDKQERKYIEMEKVLVDDEKIEAILQAEKMKEAEQKLKLVKEGHSPESPLKEKIEEVFQDAKDLAADFAHLNCFSGVKETQAHEKKENKAEKKLKEAEKRVKDLRQQLAKKMTEMIEEDDEILRKKKKEIEKLQQQLKNEEQRCVEIEEELAYDQQCVAEIIEEEEKLKERKIAHRSHHEREQH